MSADGLNKTVLWIASSKQTVKSNIFDADTNMTFTDWFEMVKLQVVAKRVEKRQQVIVVGLAHLILLSSASLGSHNSDKRSNFPRLILFLDVVSSH